MGEIRKGRIRTFRGAPVKKIITVSQDYMYWGLLEMVLPKTPEREEVDVDVGLIPTIKSEIQQLRNDIASSVSAMIQYFIR